MQQAGVLQVVAYPASVRRGRHLPLGSQQRVVQATALQGGRHPSHGGSARLLITLCTASCWGREAVRESSWGRVKPALSLTSGGEVKHVCTPEGAELVLSLTPPALHHAVDRTPNTALHTHLPNYLFHVHSCGQAPGHVRTRRCQTRASQVDGACT